MNAGILWYVVVGAIALVLTRLLVRPTRASPPPKPKEPPRWHDGFDHPA